MATKTFSVRFQEVILDEVKDLAVKHKRTVNAEIEFLVEKGIKKVCREDAIIENLDCESSEDDIPEDSTLVINQQEKVG